MFKYKFSAIQPMICTMVSEGELADAIKVIKDAEFGGTESIILNLMGDGKMGLKEKYLNPTDLKKLFSCTTLPICVCYYRWHYMRGTLHATDDERMKVLVMAAECGAAAVDMEGDFFDMIPGPDFFTPEAREYSIHKGNKPREISYDPKAIERQKECIKKFHDLGCEVLMSIHSRVHLTADDAVALYKEIASRGVDIVKIVGADCSYDDLIDTLDATVQLNKIKTVPFLMMSHGAHSAFARWFNAYLGSCLWFAQEYFVSDGFYLQPLLKNVKAMRDSVKNLDVILPPEEQGWL